MGGRGTGRLFFKASSGVQMTFLGGGMRNKNGFSLIEMLMAMTVVAILTGVSLNVFGTFHHGIVETTARYEQFVAEKVNELRCRTSVVRGVSKGKMTCNDVFRMIQMENHTYFSR